MYKNSVYSIYARWTEHTFRIESVCNIINHPSAYHEIHALCFSLSRIHSFQYSFPSNH